MLKKSSKADLHVLFIDASKKFVKITNNNKLVQKNIGHVMKAYAKRQNCDFFARLAPNKEIAKQDYNLSVSNYVESEDTREKITQIVEREQLLRPSIGNR